MGPVAGANSAGQDGVASLNPGGCALYVHRKDGEMFRLYFTQPLGCRED
jgi:hypothetical protein